MWNIYKNWREKKQRKKASSTDHMMTLMRGPLNVLRCRADISVRDKRKDVVNQSLEFGLTHRLQG